MVVCAAGKMAVRRVPGGWKRVLPTDTSADLKECQQHLECSLSIIGSPTRAGAYDEGCHPDVPV
jgi:hypothetical protein